MFKNVTFSILLGLILASTAFSAGNVFTFQQTANSLFATASIQQDNEFTLASKAFDRGDYTQAVFYYTKYLSKYPKAEAAYYNRGLAYNYLKNYDAALADLTRAIEINPQYWQAYSSRGFSYQSQQMYESAIREYSTAIKINPNEISYRNRGLCYQAINKYDLAKADFNEVERIKSGVNNSTTAPGNGTNSTENKLIPTNPNGVKWRPVVEMNNQIFPSFFLATATVPIVESNSKYVIGDSHGKIGLHIINPQSNAKIKVGIHLEPLISYQEFETTLTDKGELYLFFPKIIWNWEALKRFKKPSPANAIFTLFVNGQQIEKQNIVVRIRSLNEAVFAYRFLDNEKWADTSNLFAAYVNEDHEWIDKLLKEALDTRLVDSFSGYQGGAEGVKKQLIAIWYILQRRGFKYSNITDTSGTGATDMVYSQYVRFFEEAINVSQANCVDGSVLIASILRKIGINVGLVLIPGHCFLVFDMDGKGDLWGLETTVIGQADLNDFEAKDKVNVSVAVLKKALEVGDQRLKESLVKIKEGDPRYKLVSISKARKDGINPIAW